MNSIHISSFIKIECCMNSAGLFSSLNALWAILKMTILILVVYSSPLSGQSMEDSTPAALNQRTNSVDELVPQVVFQKVNSRKSFKLLPGQKVWIASRKTKNNLVGFKAAVITEIKDHQITFAPKNKQFEEFTIADSLLNYIEFVNAGSVARGIVVNGVLVSAIVVVTFVMLVDFILFPFTGNEPLLSNFRGFGPLPWDDFHKHIKVKTPRGKRKWKVEAQEMISSR